MLECPETGRGFWEAFWTLHRSRTYSGGMVVVPNPLAYSEIVRYAETEGLDVTETVQAVQAMDGTWLSVHHESQKKRRKRKGHSDE